MQRHKSIEWLQQISKSRDESKNRKAHDSSKLRAEVIRDGRGQKILEVYQEQVWTNRKKLSRIDQSIFWQKLVSERATYFCLEFQRKTERKV